MIFEKYTLILKHEMQISEEDTYAVEEPLVLVYAVDRSMGYNKPILLNYMLDRFKHEILKRTEETQ